MKYNPILIAVIRGRLRLARRYIFNNESVDKFLTRVEEEAYEAGIEYEPYISRTSFYEFISGGRKPQQPATLSKYIAFLKELNLISDEEIHDHGSFDYVVSIHEPKKSVAENFEFQSEFPVIANQVDAASGPVRVLDARKVSKVRSYYQTRHLIFQNQSALRGKRFHSNLNQTKTLTPVERRFGYLYKYLGDIYLIERSNSHSIGWRVKEKDDAVILEHQNRDERQNIKYISFSKLKSVELVELAGALKKLPDLLDYSSSSVRQFWNMDYDILDECFVFDIINNDFRSIINGIASGEISIFAVSGSSKQSILHLALENGAFDVARIFLTDTILQSLPSGKYIEPYTTFAGLNEAASLQEVVSEFDWTTTDGRGRIAAQVARGVPMFPNSSDEQRAYSIWISILDHQMAVSEEHNLDTVLFTDDDGMPDPFPNMF